MSAATDDPIGTRQSEAKGISATRVFISYSRKDQEFADRLEHALKARGLVPLIDRSEIGPFEDWWKRIESLILQADTMVFVISPDSVASPVCQQEVSFAVSLNKRLAPVVHRRTDDASIPKDLAQLNYLFFDAGDFEAKVEALHGALTSDIDWVRKHTELAALARRWDTGKRRRPRGLLLRSPDLEGAERWIASRPHGAPLPTEATQAFIARSRQDTTRRRNLLVASLSGGLILALVLSGVAIWQREVARTNFEAARGTADAVVNDLALGLRDVEGMRAETVRQILDRAADAYRKLSDSTGHTVEIERGQARMYVLFANTYSAKGDNARAWDSASAAVAIMRRLVELDPTDWQYQRELGNAREAAATVMHDQGRKDDALRERREILALFLRLLDRPGATRQTLKGDVLTSYMRLGDSFLFSPNPRTALEPYTKALAIARELATAPDDPASQEHLARALHQLGIVWTEAGDHDKALKSRQEALSIALKVLEAHPDNTRWQYLLGLFYMNIGEDFERASQLQEALDNYNAGIQFAAKLVKVAGDENPSWMQMVADFYGRGANVLVKMERLEDALESYRVKLSMVTGLLKLNYTTASLHLHRAKTLRSIGETLVGLKRVPEALEYFRDSLREWEGLFDVDPNDVTVQLNMVGVQAQLADNGDRPLERLQWIVDNLTKLKDDARLSAEQRKWVLESLPDFTRDLEKAGR